MKVLARDAPEQCPARRGEDAAEEFSLCEKPLAVAAPCTAVRAGILCLSAAATALGRRA